MPSPFPGMDPYLESPVFFGDLHDGLIHIIKSLLQRALPVAYYAAASDRLWVEAAGDERTIEPDVNVLGREDESRGSAPPSSAAVGLAEPVVVPVAHDEFREPYVDILTRSDSGEVVVATLEVLSPSNKRRGPGRDLYLKKQSEILDQGRTHLVEIDLLRGGEHTTAVPRAAAVRRAKGFDYHVCVRQAGRWTEALVYPIRLRDRLPRFAIPLLPGDGEVVLDLQNAFDRGYEDGPFAKRVDYRGSVPLPPLSPEDADWVAERLNAAGK